MSLKNYLAVAAATVALLGLTSQANATFLTSNGTIQLHAGTTANATPPINDVLQVGFVTGGLAYTNQYTDTTPFAAGAEIRTITVQIIQGVRNQSGTVTPVNIDVDSTAGLDLRNVVVITALRGTIFDDPTAGTAALFTEGRAFVSYATSDAFDSILADDPTTWNFDARFSEFALVNDSVAPGFAASNKALQQTVAANDPGSPVAGTINTSAPNTADIGNQGARFLFLEASTAAENSAAGPDGSGEFGDDFIRNIELPPAFTGLPVLEGVVSRVDQQVDTGDFDTAGLSLTTLNHIWDTAFTGEEWASAITQTVDADPTKWFAGTAANTAATGDFRGIVGGELGLGVQAVPEPGSMTLLGLGLAGLALYRIRRRKS